eukprot:ANDGO_07558.mRNA.1 Protein kintoun
MASKDSGKVEMTPDEMDRFEKAMKDPEFLKLFAEFAKELENPETAREYKQYLDQVEAESGERPKAPNGGEVIFPEPGFCFKVSSTELGGTKVFVNVCSCDKIDPPQEGSKGEWRVPLSLGAVRNLKDEEKKDTYQVTDIVFSPVALTKGNADAHFKRFLIDLCMDYVEQKHGIKLKRESFKIMKRKSKGDPQWQTIRSKNAPELSTTSSPPTQKKRQQPAHEPTASVSKPAQNKKIVEIASKRLSKIPHYEIVHVGNFEIQDFLISGPSSVAPKRYPKQLSVRVQLPDCESAASVDLEIESQKMVLAFANEEYDNFEIALPFEVDSDSGSAKFDKAKKILSIELPVIPPKAEHRPPVTAPAEETAAAVATSKHEAAPAAQDRVNSAGHDQSTTHSAVAEVPQAPSVHPEGVKPSEEHRSVPALKEQPKAAVERNQAPDPVPEPAKPLPAVESKKKEEIKTTGKDAMVHTKESAQESAAAQHTPMQERGPQRVVAAQPTSKDGNLASQRASVGDVTLSEFISSFKLRNTLVYDLD